MSPVMVGAYLGTSPVDMARLGAVGTLPARPGWEASTDTPVLVAAGGTDHLGFPGLAVLADGTLYATWRSGADHVGGAAVIKASTSSDNGATWSTATTILSETSIDYRDPALTLLSDGRIACQFFKYAGGVSTGVFVSYSSDDGATWGTPTSIPFGFTLWAACSGPIAEPAAGTLVAIAYGKNTAQTYTSIRSVTSTDNGATWGSDTLVLDGQAHANNYEEPFVGVLADGRVMAHIRSSTDKIRRRVFRESGGTWGLASTVYAGVEGRPSWLQLDSGRILLADREYGGVENNVLMLTETDEHAATATHLFGPGAEVRGAYQQMAHLPDGRIGVLFSSETTGGGGSASLYWTTATRARQPAVPTYAAEVATDSPSAFWGFDDTTGTTLGEDGNTYPGTLVNSPTLSATGLVRDGGTSIDFDGTNDYFTVAHNAALNASGAFTFEVWLKCDTPTADRFWPIASKSGYSTTPGQWSISYDNRTSQGSPQRLRAVMGSGATSAQLDWDRCGGDMALGGHLVVTVSGTGLNQTMRIYWNGIIVASRANATITWTAGNTSVVDSHVSTLYFDGKVDAMAIYHAELSAARVLAHYRAGITA